MLVLSEKFAEHVHAVWGNPERVAKVGINETFKHPDIGLDQDDQINHAMRIGILAGMTADKTPQAFIDGFAEALENALDVRWS